MRETILLFCIMKLLQAAMLTGKFYMCAIIITIIVARCCMSLTIDTILHILIIAISTCILTESAEVAIMLSTFDKEVNVNFPVKLRCVAYGSGGLSAPIEWTSVTNGRTSTIGNSTSTQVIMIVQMAD